MRSDYEGTSGKIIGGMPGSILAARAFLAPTEPDGASGTKGDAK